MVCPALHLYWGCQPISMHHVPFSGLHVWHVLFRNMLLKAICDSRGCALTSRLIPCDAFARLCMALTRQLSCTNQCISQKSRGCLFSCMHIHNHLQMCLTQTSCRYCRWLTGAKKKNLASDCLLHEHWRVVTKQFTVMHHMMKAQNIGQWLQRLPLQDIQDVNRFTRQCIYVCRSS